ncbi:acyl-CoA thioesterase [Georgenia subflava]|uniref:Acyl-CoA thioesterase n=1 Tax=Georgenia subflava TaxID=1622177 RepID=A0A6N7EKG2_9MICO|nr:acyl-CoA thioesterase [Georgenia subflava]
MARLTIDVQMRWSDIDGYQHVNNARMFTLLEEARIAAFWASTPGDKGFEPVGGGVDPAHGAAVPGTKVLDTGPGSGTNTYIARQEIEYLAPLPYTLRPVPVQLWISHLGGASLDICYEIPGPDGPAARAMTTLVLIDEETERPRRMTAAERESWSHYLDDPIPFRRRPVQDT